MKKSIAIILAFALMLGLTACNNDGDNLKAIQEIESMTDERLIELAQDLLTGLNLFSKYDVSDFIKPDDFGVELESVLYWERWHQLQTSANSRESAKQQAESFFETNYKGIEYTIDFIGENDYYYSFRITYEEELHFHFSDDNDEWGSDSVYQTQTWRYLIYKDSAVNYTSDGVPQIEKKMLKQKSVRDILDLITYFYVSEHYNYGRHQQLTRVLHRYVEKTNDHGSGFIYTYYFVTIEITGEEPEERKYWSQLGVHRDFIDGKTGEISDLSNEIQKTALMPE